MLAVIDYGAGNLRSVLHALNYLNVESVRVVRSPHELRGASKIILPGVGAFGAGMAKLHAQDLVKPIRDMVISGIPYLGICLGMQFLFTESDEMGVHAGLDLLHGKVTRFENLPALKIPHMGWNTLTFKQDSSLNHGIPDDSYAYFIHSYYCVPAHAEDVLTTTTYGIEFTSSVHRDNIYGVQFHPEKSQQIGLRLLTNFLEL